MDNEKIYIIVLLVILILFILWRKFNKKQNISEPDKKSKIESFDNKEIKNKSD